MNASLLQEKLSSWKPEGDGRHSLGFSADGWSVNLTALQNDALATRTWEMSLARTGPAPANFTLKQWAERIAARASGLLEDLKVVEIDTQRNEAILRSDSPSRKDATAAYYEIALHSVTRAVVRRWQADTKEGTRREQVSFAITHEVLAKLAEDITRD